MGINLLQNEDFLSGISLRIIALLWIECRLSLFPHDYGYTSKKQRWIATPTTQTSTVMRWICTAHRLLQPVEIWLQRPGWCFDDVHMYTYTWIRIYLKVHWRPFLDGFRTFFRSKGVKVHQASCDLTLRVAWRNPLQMWKNSGSCWENQIHFRVQPKGEFQGEK